MVLEMLVGLHVVDDDAYQSYHDEIMSILKSHGGGFEHHAQAPAYIKGPLSLVPVDHPREPLNSSMSDRTWVTTILAS